MAITEEHQYLASGFRTIPAWSGYAMNPGMEVWSLPRNVPCKGGKTRYKAAKQIKPDDGRVTLSQDNRRGRFHVYLELYPITFPDLLEAALQAERQRPQATCRKGHPLMEFEHETLESWMTPKPRITHWGTGNRICLWCCTPPDSFPTFTYSRAYGVAIPSHYSNTPAQPKLRELQPVEAEELEWDDYGYSVK